MRPGLSCKRAQESFPPPSTILRAHKGWKILGSQAHSRQSKTRPSKPFLILCAMLIRSPFLVAMGVQKYEVEVDVVKGLGPEFTGKQRVSGLGRHFTMS